MLWRPDGSMDSHLPIHTGQCPLGILLYSDSIIARFPYQLQLILHLRHRAVLIRNTPVMLEARRQAISSLNSHMDLPPHVHRYVSVVARRAAQDSIQRNVRLGNPVDIHIGRGPKRVAQL